MFRNRKTSQKPSDGFYEAFKATFPQLASTSTSVDGSHTTTTAPGSLDINDTTRPYADEHDLKDMDPTPKGNEPWRFTPSLLDPNSFAFSSFANQPPGYYTPTPGGTNTLYHSQAGDLHTPGFTMGLGTPLSLPTSEGSMHAGHAHSGNLHAFQAQVSAIAPNAFHNANPFAFHQQQHHPQQQQQHESFAPHEFSHRPPTFETFNSSHEDAKLDAMHLDTDMQEHSPAGPFVRTDLKPDMQHAVIAPPPMENFRYHVTLNAPTAMIRHADEIPVTYLNKGQAYSILVMDTTPAQHTVIPPTYRTFVRISFEDETQRQRPAACWQLWKEGRGSNEAHQRGGRLQAVEFVDQSHSSSLDAASRPRIELESASFDGFSVIWTPPPNGPPECAVSVRFNFLSTDFSHSKGVKGIPVRLCAKTELRSSVSSPDTSRAEICFCKVKLFRDHGAERKLANDVAHVKKSIEKLKQQIAQVEAGTGDHGKRKRSGSQSRQMPNARPGKVQKHKRTWSMSSASSAGNRASQEEDLQLKLAAYQDMFTSTRPTSILFLKGDEIDDPDLHPVYLTGEPHDLTRTTETNDTSMWERQSVATSSIVSPTPSQHSIPSIERCNSTFQQPSAFPVTKEWPSISQTATGDLAPNGHHFSLSSIPVKVTRVNKSDNENLSSWIEALGVDYSYQPPPDRPVKPIACFYVQPRFVGRPPEDNYYRAVYLMQRNLHDFIHGIAVKCKVEPHKVLRIVRINKQGLNILLDDQSVVELPEGQDMVAEFQEFRSHSPMKREWDTNPDNVQADGDMDLVNTVQSEGYELRLLY
ncbi:hypothetical protein EJ06DRAFT_538154 [Trichodelitschia bisporula]|uniref:Grh/CP2 DB domain-containing protein n=1 Tax=Trichodelitschia bisporula TaxID=703511 RepID=A0A6G1HVM9_9PEZI|nr:hypothetical protein EJ06DRAFT_538154 [Trichodelitschia bisporula]